MPELPPELSEILAVETGGEVHLRSREKDLAALFDHKSPLIRKKVIEFVGLADAFSWDDRIAAAMLEDVDAGVRAAAARSLGSKWYRRRYLDELVLAIGDPHPNPRRSAAEAVANRSSHLTGDQAYHAVDVAISLLMASKAGSNSFDFAAGATKIFAASMYDLVSQIGSQTPSDPPIAPHIVFWFLVSLFANPLIPRESRLAFGSFAEVEEIFDAIDRELPLTREEFELTFGENGGVPPLSVVLRAVESSFHLTARRLAALAYFVRQWKAEESFLEPARRTDLPYSPLHLRLKNWEAAQSPAKVCHELIKHGTSYRGTTVLSSLFCLAATGDGDALESLEDRLISGEFENVSIAPHLVTALLEGDARRKFPVRVLGSEAITTLQKFSFIEDRCSDFFGTQGQIRAERFLAEVAGDAGRPLRERIRAADILNEWRDTPTPEQSASELDTDNSPQSAKNVENGTDCA